MSTRITTAQLVDWLGRWRDAVTDQKDHLTDLDRAIGDADHGFNLARGTAAVTEKLEATPPQDVAGLGKVAGMALVMSVGGASGPLYGTFFLRFGTAGGDATELDAPAHATGDQLSDQSCKTPQHRHRNP
jgi:dihydroxyacetone kinase-like protein